MDAPPRPPLSDTQCRRFAALAVLDRLVHTPEAFQRSPLEGDDALLEPLLAYVAAEDLVTLGPDEAYRPTPLGRQAVQRLLHQQASYLAHFEVFAGVDLAEGTFATPDAEDLGDPRWADLRVAVAEHKRVDPYRLMFVCLLAGGALFDNPGWKFELAPGSSFFRGLEEIVRGQPGAEDLAYEDEDGSDVAGEDVLEDVILHGARLSRQWLAEDRQRQISLLEELEPLEEDEDAPLDPDAQPETAFTVALVPYDPWGPADHYASSATYVEPLWLEPYW